MRTDLTVITIRCIVKGNAKLAETVANCAVSDLSEEESSIACFEVGEAVPLTPADSSHFDRHIQLMNDDDDEFEDEDNYDDDEDEDDDY